jgi:transmembrane sensor
MVGKSIIDLTSTKGSINTRSATINNTGETLTYNSNRFDNGSMNTLTVAPGMDYLITLADGSKVWMNSTTKIDFPFSFSGKTREISIDGEAYLEVAKKNDQPFIVHLPGSEVQVLGTEFNVNTYDTGTIKVSLIEGSVKFNAASGNLTLKPGRQGVYLRNKNIYDQIFDSQKTLSWRKGIFYFDESPLEEIAKIIPRWFNTKTVIDNERNKSKRFVGVVNKNLPLSEFLKTLEYVADFKSYFDKDGVLHFK